jgi:hypothetical protein
MLEELGKEVERRASDGKKQAREKASFWLV